MKKLKKQIPLLVLETLEKYLTKENLKIKIVDPEEFLLKFVDIDEHSDFYFIIESYKVETGKYQLLLHYKPQSKESVGNHRAWTDHKSLDNLFNNWLSIIEKYDSIKTPFDDPIEKKYQEEFFTEFEIVDDDADIVSFNIEQQLFLNNYLEKVILAIENFNPESKNEELNELKQEVIELNENLTKLTKRVIIKKLSWIWARARKYGIPLLKKVLIQFKDELIKQLVKYVLEQ